MTRIWASLFNRLALSLLALAPFHESSGFAATSGADLPSCKSSGLTEFRLGTAETYADFRKKNATLRKGCAKDWTILVYMAADNELTPYAFWDLYEMEAGFRSGARAAGSTAKLDLLVQLDTRGTSGIRRFHIHQAVEPYDDKLDLEFFRRQTAADLRSPQLIETQRETGAALSEPEKLKQFLEWGLRAFPAKNTFVIIWGHGQGWTARRRAQPAATAPPTLSAEAAQAEEILDSSIRPGGMDLDDNAFAGRNFGGLAFNENSGSFLGIPSLARVLSQVSRDRLGGKPFDLYASDACLMQMAEVANELQDSTRFVAGSAQVQSFLGLPYRRLLYEINTGRFGTAADRKTATTSDEAEKIARMLPSLLEASFKPGGSQARFAPQAIKTVTLSALSSGALKNELIPALNRLGASLTAYLKETANPLRELNLDSLTAHAPSFQGSAQDLGAFLTLLDALLRDEAAGQPQTPRAFQLSESIRNARESLQRTVLEWALGTDYRSQADSFYLLGFRALSVWIPASADDRTARLSDFKKSRLYHQAPSWASFIEGLHGGQSP